MSFSRISRALLCGAAMPPAVAMLVWVYAFRLEPAYLLESVAVRIYVLATILLLVVEMVRNVLQRAFSPALIYLGLLLAVLQGVAWYGFRFDGMAAVGNDEQITEYYTSRSGAFATPPRIPLKVAGITEDPLSVSLVRDGIETQLEAGKALLRDGFVFHLEKIEHAPLVSVRTVRGEPVDEAYLKLTSSGEREDFIMFGRLPHRFYVSEVREPGSGGTMFKLKVVRDKLTIIDTPVQAGEEIYFDGHFVSCRPGAPWVRLAVEKRQSRLLLWSGLLSVLAGTAGAARARRGNKE